METMVTIVMIDDREENLLALEAVLAAPGLRLVPLRSGEEALRFILRENTDDIAVVLLDVQMPGMNGFETARLIKARKKTKDIPIVFLTAISKSTEHVIEGYQAGSIDYIFKPFDPEVLRLKVEAFVRLHRYHLQIRRHGEQLARKTMQLQEANRKLERAEGLARIVAEASLDAILMLDQEGHILSANPAMETMLGYTSAEVSGKGIQLLLPEFAHQVPGGVWETSAISKDGRYIPVDCQITSAIFEDTCLIVCTIRNASSRKMKELAQQEQFARLETVVEQRTAQLQCVSRKQLKSEERFQTIFLASPCAMIIRRLSDLYVLDVNDSFLDITGFPREEVIGCQDDILHVEMENRDRVTRESFRNQKIRFTNKAGEVREGLLSSELIEIGDEPSMLNVLIDITEKVRWEAELGRLARLNLVGEMAAGIAHEIRNPMTTIRGFLQMSRTKGGTMSTDYIDIMLEELNRANSIITEYLSLAKNKVTDRKQQQLNTIIETLYPLIQAEAMLAGKYVQISYSKLPPLQLDEKEIRQLILNLTMNGLEAMSVGGVLRIETYCEHGDAVLLIRDQGCGIKKEYLEKLGTPFFTTKDNGTGLGLAVCYSIALRHQAIIEVNSGSDGTTFRIRFPLAEKSDRKQAEERSADGSSDAGVIVPLAETAAREHPGGQRTTESPSDAETKSGVRVPLASAPAVKPERLQRTEEAGGLSRIAR